MTFKVDKSNPRKSKKKLPNADFISTQNFYAKNRCSFECNDLVWFFLLMLEHFRCCDFISSWSWKTILANYSFRKFTCAKKWKAMEISAIKRMKNEFPYAMFQVVNYRSDIPTFNVLITCWNFSHRDNFINLINDSIPLPNYCAFANEQFLTFWTFPINYFYFWGEKKIKNCRSFVRF